LPLLSLSDTHYAWLQYPPLQALVKTISSDLVSPKQALSTDFCSFLQARLQLDMISGLSTDKAIKAALQTLPNGLAATYENILLSTLKRYPKSIADVKTILQWLAASITPLTAAQLAEIVAIAPEDTTLDLDGVSTRHEDVVEPILQLLVLHRHSGGTVVQFSHFSVAEFLCDDGTATGPAKEFYVDLKEAHARATEICLQYLSFSEFDDPKLHMRVPGITQFLDKYALFKYAAINWPTHLKKSNLSKIEFERRILPRLSWFLHAKSNNFNNWQHIMRVVFPHWRASTLPPLLFAIRTGIHQIVDMMLPQLLNVNQKSEDGFTFLAAAASGNQVLIAKRLIEMGAEVDLSTKDRLLTPLHIAAENACVEMVELLVSAGASMKSRSSSKTTPFYRAARGGSVKILRLLHEKGSEIDAKTWDRWTPLMEAVENGHEPAVDLLLEWGADPAQQSADDVTPLSLAHVLSHASIERKLKDSLKRLGKDFSPTDLEMTKSHFEDDVSDYDSDAASDFQQY